MTPAKDKTPDADSPEAVSDDAPSEVQSPEDAPAESQSGLPDGGPMENPGVTPPDPDAEQAARDQTQREGSPDAPPVGSSGTTEDNRPVIPSEVSADPSTFEPGADPEADRDVEFGDEPEEVPVDEDGEVPSYTYVERFSVGDSLSFDTYDEARQYGESRGTPSFQINKRFVREDTLADGGLRQTVRGGEDAGPLTNIGGITPPT